MRGQTDRVPLQIKKRGGWGGGGVAASSTACPCPAPGPFDVDTRRDPRRRCADQEVLVPLGRAGADPPPLRLSHAPAPPALRPLSLLVGSSWTGFVYVRQHFTLL